MSPNYLLTEAFPRPSYPYHTGRGGAGNVVRKRPQLVNSSNANTINSSDSLNNSTIDPELANCVYPPPRGMSVSTNATRPSQRWKGLSSGRGGFGNLHPASELAMFSFDEELERLNKTQDSIAPVYHVGRGGMGNLARDRASTSVTDSPWSSSTSYSMSASSAESTESEGSRLRSALEKIKNNFSWLR